MRTVLADLRYAFRVMARTPSFAAAVVGVMALGIGANTTMFSIVNAVLMRPLPFEEPDRLVRIFTRMADGEPFEVAPGKFHDWQREAQSFEGMAMYRSREFALTGTGTARAVEAGVVGAGFFEIVRARPALGRTFREEENTLGAHRAVILSDRFWRAELGGDPDVIGRTVSFSDEPYTVVGVMPASASVASWAPMASDIWIPLALSAEQRASRQNHNQQGVARLKRDVELPAAHAEMNAIAARLAREFPDTDGGGWGAMIVPMQDAIVGDSRTLLLMLLGAVGLVLLVACANVGNLLFARALSRRKEIAIRSALGAKRGRVIQQLLVEALVLATVGGALGLLLSVATLTAASSLLATYVPRANEISIDVRVLLFVLAVSMVAGVLAGLLPALRAGRSDLTSELSEGGRGNSALGVRTRRALIVCEVALSLVLLMGASVVVQSLLSLRRVDTGFDPANVLTMDVRLADARYATPAQRSAFFDKVVQRIRALPGVEAAGTIDDLPFIPGSGQPLTRAGYVRGSSTSGMAVVAVRRITPGYLRALGIPVVRGRDIVEGDGDVLLVSREAARLVWGADDPIGRRGRLPLLSTTLQREVVGIVGDVKQDAVAGPLTPTVYYYSRERDWGQATLVIRTSTPPAAFARPVVAAIHAIDPEQPVGDIRTMAEVLDSTLTPQRFSALVLGLFAGAALLLASVGMYAVLSYIVRGRSREIGIRTALGAPTADVLRLVIVEGMSPALVGIAVGAIAALVSAKVLRTLVFGISASDPLTLAAVAATLVVVALMASLVPAYRALRLDPVKVLRAD
jgi:predicted permease